MMPEMDQPPAIRRRWFRFSLRMLLVVVTLLCVWLGIQVNAARRQREAVAEILKAGGTVSYDYKPPGPVWGRNAIGDDYFQTVNAVQLSHPPDRRLRQSYEITLVKGISFEHDPALASLEKLSHLEILSLRGTHVTGEMLLGYRLSGLTDVDIYFCDLDDAGRSRSAKWPI
jgi:hypothetical protein